MQTFPNITVLIDTYNRENPKSLLNHILDMAIHLSVIDSLYPNQDFIHCKAFYLLVTIIVLEGFI
jgi:hypothetical protein